MLEVDTPVSLGIGMLEEGHSAREEAVLMVVVATGSVFHHSSFCRQYRVI